MRDAVRASSGTGRRISPRAVPVASLTRAIMRPRRPHRDAPRALDVTVTTWLDVIGATRQLHTGGA